MITGLGGCSMPSRGRDLVMVGGSRICAALFKLDDFLRMDG